MEAGLSVVRRLSHKYIAKDPRAGQPVAGDVNHTFSTHPFRQHRRVLATGFTKDVVKSRF